MWSCGIHVFFFLCPTANQARACVGDSSLGFFNDTDLGMALPGGQLHEVDACSEGGKLELDLSINGLMELLVDFSALAIVELYLGGIAVVGGKPKSKLIAESIGKGDGRKGGENLLGEGHDSPKKTLAKVGAACGEGTGDATLSDGLLDVEPAGSTRAGAS